MRHILFTLKGCPYGLLDDEAHIRNVLANACKPCRKHIAEYFIT